MMNPLCIPATKSSPSVDFDPKGGRLTIKGESYPENCGRFYDALFTGLGEYLAWKDAPPLLVDMEIIYFNSSTSKTFMDLFDMLDEAVQDGKSVEVVWHYHEENEIALECGEEFQEDVSVLPFHLREFS